MPPELFTSVASRLFHRRRWFLAMSLLSMASSFAMFAFGPSRLALYAPLFIGPLVVVPWGLLCACIWFHPEHGNLQSGSKMVGKLPQSLQVFVRWYAAIFLAFFLFFGAVAMPLISLIRQ